MTSEARPSNVGRHFKTKPQLEWFEMKLRSYRYGLQLQININQNKNVLDAFVYRVSPHISHIKWTTIRIIQHIRGNLELDALLTTFFFSLKKKKRGCKSGLSSRLQDDHGQTAYGNVVVKSKSTIGYFGNIQSYL